MSDTRIPPAAHPTLADDPPDHRPRDRFWPYVELPEEPTDDELAALDPDLHDALFGRVDRPFSITLSFPTFDGEACERAIALAQEAAEYRVVGEGEARRHRVRCYPGDARRLRDIYELVEAAKGCDVLIDDRPVPYARELWLPLVWILLLK